MPNTIRRLLDAHQVAEKLGYSKSWFEHNKTKLEANGFPPPVLDTDKFGTRRWDNYAIDAWLDSKMDPQLREQSSRDTTRAATIDWSAKLSQRAREMQI